MRKVLLFFICIGTAFISNGQITTTSSGNWSSGSTWSSGVVPTSTDNVVIGAAHVIAVDDASAVCNSISFGASTSKLNMSSATSVLSVYGDFAISTTTHKVFSAWTAGAKIKFSGGATQILSGWTTSSSSFGTSMVEMVVDKTIGTKVKTIGADMKFSVGTSLEIISGTFELTKNDDMECYDINGTGTSPTITIRANGTFDSNSDLNSTSQTQYIRKYGGGATDETPKIGIVTVYGIAKFAPSSSNRINFSGLNIESGGSVEFPSSRNTSSSGFNPGPIVVKSGGLFNQNTTTNFWYLNTTNKTTVTIKSGGEFECGSSSINLSNITLTQEAGSSFRYSYFSTSNPTNVGSMSNEITSYKTLIFSGSNSKTLPANITIEEALQLSGAFTTLALGGFTLTYGPNAVLRYGASSANAAQTVTAAEWPATGGPTNVQMYNSGLTLGLPRTITGTLSLTSGTLTHSGNLTMASGSTISRARGALATAPNFGATTNLNYNSSTTKVTTDLEVPSSGLNNFTMNTAMGITIGSSLTVNGTLTLTNGIADLGANNISTAAVAGGNANSFINTNGAGVLTVKNVGSTSTNVPVGYTTYSPVVLSNSGTADDFSINVAPGTICNAAALSSVNRVWNITEAVAGSSNASIGMQWSPYLEGTSFLRNNSAAVHCSSSAIDIKGTIGAAAVTDTFFVQTIAGISSFSPFGVTSDAIILPARGLALSWKKMNNSNLLLWKTMGEFNTAFYEVESSSSSTNFKAIGKIAAQPGNNAVENNYQFEDVQPLNGVNYYRLRVLDNNSTVQYSPVVAIRSENTQSGFQVYPNPVSGKTINIAIEATEASIYQIGIFSMQGQLLQQEQRAITANGSLQQIQLRSQIAPGMYLLKLTNAKGNQMKQMIAVQ
jgi:hypothetical protein